MPIGAALAARFVELSLTSCHLFKIDLADSPAILFGLVGLCVVQGRGIPQTRRVVHFILCILLLCRPG